MKEEANIEKRECEKKVEKGKIYKKAETIKRPTDTTRTGRGHRKAEQNTATEHGFHSVGMIFFIEN